MPHQGEKKDPSEVPPSRPTTILVTEAYLERLTKACINCINTGDYSFETPAGREFTAHVAPDFYAQLARWPGRDLSWGELCEAWRGMSNHGPISLQNISSVVAKMTAVVHLELEMDGSSPDMRLSAVAELMWRRDEQSGEWGLWKYSNIWNMIGT